MIETIWALLLGCIFADFLIFAWLKFKDWRAEKKRRHLLDAGLLVTTQLLNQHMDNIYMSASSRRK